MKTVQLGNSLVRTPRIIIGCMRIPGMNPEQMNRFLHTALEEGANFFDHADIYGGGKSEEVFGDALSKDASIHREEVILQSKCGIRSGFFDQSKEHIISSVDGILSRLKTEYLDILLIHRPDALVEPEEVAEAFDELSRAGKVRSFGVSNHKPMQIELLKKYVKQDILVNQLQFSIPVSNMVANGLEVNMTSDGAIDRDGSVLDYCRLKDITVQAWSPFQMPEWRGPFLFNDAYKELNEAIGKLSEKYQVSETTIAAAWILRHPAKMQLVTGTTKESRIREICAACDIELTREEWYRLYLAAGHKLP